MLIDQVLPEYDFREVRTRRIKASPADTFAALKAVTPAEMPLLRLLFMVRSLPARINDRGELPGDKDHPLYDQMMHNGFVALGEKPPHELVFGTIGQFWKPTGGFAQGSHTAEEFAAFDVPGYAKVATNFTVEPRADGRGLVVRTEMRIRTLGPEAHRKFRRYWQLIHLGSAATRLSWLAAARRRAERGITEDLLLLRIGGWANLAIALGHLLGLLRARRFFEFSDVRPEMERLAQINPALPAALTVATAANFGLFGLYALSAAGDFRPLPLTRVVLPAIAAVYVARAIGGTGLGGYLEDRSWKSRLFSTAALGIGLCYATGARKILR